MSKNVALILALMCLTGLGLVALPTVKAQFLGSVYINPDGSVTGTNSIQRNENIYTLTANISGGIQVQKSNIVIDGVGYTVQGNGAGRGLDLSNSVGEDPSRSIISNVTLENLRIVGFGFGVETNGGGNHTFIGNYFSDCVEGIDLGASSFNNITYCTFVESTLSMVYQANYNIVAKNNFLNSSVQVWLSGYETIDGNYWSDYNGRDADGDGTGDTPYGHPSAIIDNHPLMNPVSIPKPEFNDGTGEPEPFPTLLAVAVTVTVVALVGVGLLIYFKKRKH